MASSKATSRIQKEIKRFLDDPPPYIHGLSVDDANMRKIFFLLEGPPDTPYVGGWYVLRLELHKDYPMAPPDFYMVTPNGRFHTETKVCTSFSSYHPESWSPTYTFSTLVCSFLSFMCENSQALGVMNGSAADCKKFAKASVKWNIDHGHAKKFPLLLDIRKGKLPAPRPTAAVQPQQPSKPPATVPVAAAPLQPSAVPQPCTSNAATLRQHAVDSCANVAAADALGVAVAQRASATQKRSKRGRASAQAAPHSAVDADGRSKRAKRDDCVALVDLTPTKAARSDCLVGPGKPAHAQLAGAAMVVDLVSGSGRPAGVQSAAAEVIELD